MRKRTSATVAVLMLLAMLCSCGGGDVAVTTPEVTTPEVTTPEVTTPEVTTPEVTTPGVTTPPQTTEDEAPPTTDYGDGYVREITENRSVRTEREGIPTEFDRGKGYDDLIFYASEADRNQEKLQALPVGTVYVDRDLLLEKRTTLSGAYGSAVTVPISDGTLSFSDALRVEITKKPDHPYGAQIKCGAGAIGSEAVDGDMLLLTVCARVVEGHGELGFVIEEGGDHYEKLLSVTVLPGTDWQTFYFPVAYREGFRSVNIRFGYGLQTLEIADFSIVNYGTAVEIDDLPKSEERADLSKDAEWRTEALERIEQIRKGDIRVVVTDENGAPLSDVAIELRMFEHEFEFGVAVSQYRVAEADTMRKIGRLFNAAVLENELKWSYFESYPGLPDRLIAALRNVGITTVRGHCLIWDRVRREGDSSVPADLPSLYGDRAALTARIRSHIEEIMTAMDGKLVEWDVLNEACANTVMQDLYGRELIAEWFAMARATGVDADLYYNDYVMTEELFTLLDLMEEMNVDYDGIGVQSHYSSPKSMTEILAFYERLSAYGKKIKITEYDFACYDEELQAAFTRDLLILSFSMDAIEGFYLWGIKGGEGERYVCYDASGNPRLALAQIEDLLYHKWWTEETGRTDEDGSFACRGFYGSYEISVIANGVKKTVTVDLPKDGERTVRITMPSYP